MLLRLAWRNLWRQKRRTFVTASALALALFLSLFTRSLQEGTYGANIDNAARFYTGLAQIQHPAFADSLSIDDLIIQRDAMADWLHAYPVLRVVLPRLESVALASVGDKSKGVLVLGVAPEQEDSYSRIRERVIAGDYLSVDDNQVLVGRGVARYFALEPGDELVLYGLGYHGQTAAGVFRVKGILGFPIAQLDSQVVYMPLKLAQQLYGTGERISAWVLHTRELGQLTEVMTELQNRYGDDYNIRDWQSLAPELAQQIMMDRAGGVFLIYVLYGVVGFGLFATIVMMTLERQREFAVMLATGMLRSRLLLLVLIESMLLALWGIILGLMVAAPVLGYFYFHPITLTGDTAQMMIEVGFEPVLPVMLSFGLLLEQVVSVVVILMLCLIYPMLRIHRLNLVQALKGGAYAD
jgi:ABC-type lipoprotein release transport system permease subunit